MSIGAGPAEKKRPTRQSPVTEHQRSSARKPTSARLLCRDPPDLRLVQRRHIPDISRRKPCSPPGEPRAEVHNAEDAPMSSRVHCQESLFFARPSPLPNARCSDDRGQQWRRPTACLGPARAWRARLGSAGRTVDPGQSVATYGKGAVGRETTMKNLLLNERNEDLRALIAAGARESGSGLGANRSPDTARRLG
jgi:hypothetical protein